ncbi:hypothetical protein C4D60_Mb08t20520 [Musa balbisiana]|uniref:Uncharacterized protein n=1 Tax=Musa balbisiana TaxID=52838 RepID=A0A4S8K589_MUSBA|nr:hypothetical protein C4D60_Mb08t20520 [Musa balbisiana]
METSSNEGPAIPAICNTEFIGKKEKGKEETALKHPAYSLRQPHSSMQFYVQQIARHAQEMCEDEETRIMEKSVSAPVSGHYVTPTSVLQREGFC